MKSQTEKHANASFIIFLRIIAAVAVVIIHTKTLTNFETKGYYFLDSCRIFCIFILLINSKIYASHSRCNTILRVLCTL